jgi:3-dehydroquinate synthase
MADASFGGKCGVNAKGIKNVVGTMYHPRAILINVEFLQSLPSHQIASGLAEIAKHALLDSKYFVKEFFSSWDACLNGDLPCLEKVIAHSVAVKARFCSMGKEYRHFLNLGHTVAHALEGLEGPKLSHGVAVAIGLLVEAMVGLKRGVVSQEVVDVTRKIAACVLPSRPLAGGWDLDAWKRILVLDKKNVLGQPHVVWIRTIGELYTLNGSAAIPLEMAEVEYAYGLLSSFF